MKMRADREGKRIITKRTYIGIIVLVISMLAIAFALMITAAVLQENEVSSSIYTPIGIAAFPVLIVGAIIGVANLGRMMEYEISEKAKEIERVGCAYVENASKNKIIESLTEKGFTLKDNKYYYKRKFSLTKDVINYFVRLTDSDDFKMTIEKEGNAFDAEDYKGKNKCLILLMYSDKKVSNDDLNKLTNLQRTMVVAEIALNVKTFDSVVMILIDKISARAYFVPVHKLSISVYAHGLRMFKKLIK